jgi:hypothetical protein
VCECPASFGVNVRREFWRGSQACPVNLEIERSKVHVVYLISGLLMISGL